MRIADGRRFSLASGDGPNSFISSTVALGGRKCQFWNLVLQAFTNSGVRDEARHVSRVSGGR